MKGDVVIQVKDINGNYTGTNNLITEGFHFGEISCVYRCPRTATAIGRNYNTLARLGYVAYRELINEYPAFLKFLKHYIYLYHDQYKIQMFKIINKIFYF